MTGRNDPCSCGSGKKYKKCCLTRDQAVHEAFLRDSEDPGPAVHDPELEAWKEADGRLIRKGMKRLDQEKLNVQKLVEKYWGKGTLDRWKREGTTEAEMTEFHAWLWVDWRKTSRSKTLAEVMATDPSLSSEEKQILAGLNASHRTVYQVSRLDPGRGVELENVLEGGRIFIHDRAVSLSAEKWGLIFCRVYPAGPYHFVAGGAHAFPPREKEFVERYLAYELEKYRRRHPYAGWREFLRAKPEIFGRLTVELHQRMRRLPQVVNTDGEPVALCQVHFEVSDQTAFLAGLRAHPELEELIEPGQEEVEFTWESRRGAESIHLGRIVLTGNKLLFECNSRERAQRGRSLLERVGRLELRGEEIKDSQQILEEARRGREEGLAEEADEQPAPPPEAQAYLKEFLRRHYEKWVNEPLPALYGKTPREAAKDPRGRQQLIDLLRHMEYMDRRGSDQGDVSNDWNEMRRRLGLPEE